MKQDLNILGSNIFIDYSKCNDHNYLNETISKFREDAEILSIYKDSEEDYNNEKDLKSLLDHFVNWENVNEKKLDLEEKYNYNLNDSQNTKKIIHKNKEPKLNYGPIITFEQIKFDNSFDSLDYDLCFNLHSQIFQSIFNEEEKKEIENSNTEGIESHNNNLHNSKKNVLKMYYDSPQLPKNSKMTDSPFGHQSGLMTDRNTEKRTFKSNYANSDNSFIIRKNHICCGTKQKTKVINNSIYSNNIFTKKSTNISTKSLKLNDSLSRLRKKKNHILNKSEETNFQSNDKVNCRCLIF